MSKKWKLCLFGIGLACTAIALAYASIQLKRRRAARSCIENLQYIDGAKMTWAEENHKALNAIPTWKDLIPYLNHYWGPQGFTMPRCPAGGVYKINSVGEAPTCSIAYHVEDLLGVELYAFDGMTPVKDVLVVVKTVSGDRKYGKTDVDGHVNVMTWPIKPVNVVISKPGFVAISNVADKLPLEIHLQREVR